MSSKIQQPQRAVESTSSSDSGEQSDHEESESPTEVRKSSAKTIIAMRRPSVLASAAMGTQHYGSFYLRMGAVGKYTDFICFWD